MIYEFSGKLGYAFPLEIEIIHVDVQTSSIRSAIFLFGILQEESRLANASGAFDTYHVVVPINLIHEVATDLSVGVLNQIGVSPKKGFHIVLLLDRKSVV